MVSSIRAHILIGALEVFRTPSLWIESIRHRPVTRAGITLPDPKGEYYRSLYEGDAVQIRLGYRNEISTIWKGSVAWLRSGSTKDQLEVGVVGEEKPLTETVITQAFENETPEAIIKWAVERAGLTVGQINSPGVTLPKFVASNIPVWQVARQCAHTCQKAFGMDMSRWAIWMGADGTINWGDFDETGDVPVIATADNLITHLPDESVSGLNRVETFLISGFRHSQRFKLTDRRRGIDENFRALRVRHEIIKDKARTYIWYGQEHKKF